MIERIVSVKTLPDEEMRKIGFTDRNPNNWYLNLPLTGTIAFNVTIPKDGGKPTIYVLDEEFCQPYPYQDILERNPAFDLALSIKQQVELKVESLAMTGIFTLTG